MSECRQLTLEQDKSQSKGIDEGRVWGDIELEHAI
jgi:hypothetical protein